MYAGATGAAAAAATDVGGKSAADCSILVAPFCAGNELLWGWRSVVAMPCR